MTESGSISTNFAFDNPQYTPSERDALRDRTLTKIKTKSPSADSCEGDIVSRVMQEISTDPSTTSSFVFGATIAGNDDHSGELFSSNLDVTGVSLTPLLIWTQKKLFVSPVTPVSKVSHVHVVVVVITLLEEVVLGHK